MVRFLCGGVGVMLPVCCCRVGMAGALQAVLEKVLEKPARELVAVDLDKLLTEKKLADFFPVETWPPTFAVAKLRSLVMSSVVMCSARFVSWRRD